MAKAIWNGQVLAESANTLPIEVAASVPPTSEKHDADYVFHELTRRILPICRRVIGAQR